MTEEGLTRIIAYALKKGVRRVKDKNKYHIQLHVKISDEQKAFIDKIRKEGHTNTSDVVRIMIDRYMEHRKFLRGDKQ